MLLICLSLPQPMQLSPRSHSAYYLIAQLSSLILHFLIVITIVDLRVQLEWHLVSWAGGAKVERVRI